MSRKREQLLGYLLGALDDAERAQVERELSEQPELREQLEQLRQMLEPLEEAREEYAPPGDLVERTCAAISAAAERPVPASGPPRPAVEGAASWHSASLLDIVVAAGVCLALSLLFFPALLSSREISRRLACQDNLRHLGLALATYSDKHLTIPAIPSDGNGAFAGYYAVRLSAASLLDEDEVLLCPGACKPAELENFRVPTVTEVMAARGPRLQAVQRIAGGTYGYSIGYWDRGQYRMPRLCGQAHFLVMTDAPDAGRPNSLSINHGGRGMNALFGDLRVVFMQGCTVPTPRSGVADHAFLNHEGFVAIGLNDGDSVVGRSETPPRRLTDSH